MTMTANMTMVEAWRARREAMKANKASRIRASAAPRPVPERLPAQEADEDLSETAAALNALLVRWHRWQAGFSPIPTCSADPMFRNVKSGKTWDSTHQVIQDELDGSTMEAIDFHVGELPDEPMKKPYRSAIYMMAKNLHARANVWQSPRVPADPLERAVIYMEARNMLTRRLVSAGVM